MVRYTRSRTVILQLGLWLLSAGLVGYFGYHAVHGDRGLEAQHSFETEITVLRAELTRLSAQRAALENRAGQLEPAHVDRDLLDENARTTLGWLHPNDRVITPSN